MNICTVCSGCSGIGKSIPCKTWMHTHESGRWHHRDHNPFNEDYWANCLRENLTISSYGEGLETGREWTQEPRQSFTRQVFFQDWKANEEWGKLTKQPGEEGSSRSLILSLLVDHSLYFHPAQTAQLENKLPAYTVGSLTEKIKVETIMNLFEQIIFSDAPVERFKKFARAAENVLYPSTKHMISRDYEKFVALPSLKHRCEA